MQSILHELIVYPIKSMAGICLEQANIQTEGLEYDRRWMLVDDKGRFISQREDSRLCLFKPVFTDYGMIVTYRDDSIMVPLVAEGSALSVSVWKSNLRANEVHPKVSSWFSEQLNQRVALVKMTKLTNRLKEFDKPPHQTKVSFADGYPLLILGTASMEELNRRATKVIPKDRFRANMIVSTSVPHEEDGWSEISIGDSRLRIISPCARCVVPSIDQLSGVKGNETLTTLAEYRKFDSKIYFGANAMTTFQGSIKKGDLVRITNPYL